MPVTVRNCRNTVVVLSSLESKSLSVEWAPAGSSSGEDIQQVPDSLVQLPSFLRSVALGILKVEEDDAALIESIERQARRYQRAQDDERTELEGVLDTTSASGVLVFTEDQIDRHIEALSKSQESELSTIGENP